MSILVVFLLGSLVLVLVAVVLAGAVDSAWDLWLRWQNRERWKDK